MSRFVRHRAAGLLGLAACLLVVLSGCRYSLQGAPAPGGVSGPTYHLTATFDDVLNLPEHALVKVDGVTAGEVTSIRAHDYRAVIGMDVKRSVRLAEGTTAQVRFTTPLGDVYIRLDRPASVPAGTRLLRDGDRIPVANTSTAPSVEDTLAALAAVLNGGGIDQLRTIVDETATALKGNEPQARSLVTRLATYASSLNASGGAIDRVLTNLASLSTSLATSDDVVSQALAAFAPAFQVLSANTDQLTALLQHVASLGAVARDVVSRSRDALLADLHDLVPVVDTLVSVRDQVAPLLDHLTALAQAAPAAIPGDYANLDLHVLATLSSGSGASATAGTPGGRSGPSGPSGIAALLGNLVQGGIP